MTFWERTQAMASGCIEWTGPRDKGGYGRMSEGKLAHREAFALAKGDPSGMLVCHSCDNPSCVNPDHLWLGTGKDNQSDCVRKGRARGMDMNCCIHGHPFDDKNTYWKPGGNGRRQCRACNRAAARKYKRKIREQAA